MVKIYTFNSEIRVKKFFKKKSSKPLQYENKCLNLLLK